MKIVKHIVEPAIETEEISIKDLPSQHISNLQLKLIQRADGSSIKIPIIVAKGRYPGPVFGITAAVHGNEINGIPLIHELIKGLRLNRLHGTVVAAVVVNIPGFQQNERYLSQGVDLNHMMPGKSTGNFAEVYAHRILNKIVKKMDYVVDLHTASFGRINSLYIRTDLNDPIAAQMAYLQRPEIILHSTPSDYTLRGAAAELGKPAITIEIGDPSKFQYKYIRRSLVGIRSMLNKFEMIRSPVPKIAYSEPIICEKSKWAFTDSGGILTVLPGLNDLVEKGQQIAHIYTIFGDKSRDYLSPSPGVIIGKAVNPVAETGARIAHIGVVARKTSKLRQYLPK